MLFLPRSSRLGDFSWVLRSRFSRKQSSQQAYYLVPSSLRYAVIMLLQQEQCSMADWTTVIFSSMFSVSRDKASGLPTALFAPPEIELSRMPFATPAILYAATCPYYCVYLAAHCGSRSLAVP